VRARDLPVARRTIRRATLRLRKHFPVSCPVSVRLVHTFAREYPACILGVCSVYQICGKRQAVLASWVVIQLSIPRHGNTEHLVETLNHEWVHAMRFHARDGMGHPPAFWRQLWRIYEHGTAHPVPRLRRRR